MTEIATPRLGSAPLHRNNCQSTGLSQQNAKSYTPTTAWDPIEMSIFYAKTRQTYVVRFYLRDDGEVLAQHVHHNQQGGWALSSLALATTDVYAGAPLALKIRTYRLNVSCNNLLCRRGAKREGPVL